VKNLRLFKGDLGTATRRFVSLSQQIKDLEKERDVLKKQLEPIAWGSPDHVLRVDDIEITAAECERENFSLLKAREGLTPAIYKKLSPFISTSKYVRLTTKVRVEE
jgi:hypothetical protein